MKTAQDNSYGQNWRESTDVYTWSRGINSRLPFAVNRSESHKRSRLTLSQPNEAKGKFRATLQISFSKVLKNK